jgi:hypothetical protein
MDRGRVELVYERPVLRGEACGTTVDLQLDLGSSGIATGRLGSADVHASWTVEPNSDVTEQTAWLDARIGGRALSLSTTVSLDWAAWPVVQGAHVEGLAVDQPIALAITPVAALGGTIQVTGRLASWQVELLCGVDTGKVGIVTGNIDGTPVGMVIDPGDVFPSVVQIRGRWSGPPIGAVLTAACVLYFHLTSACSHRAPNCRTGRAA